MKLPLVIDSDQLANAQADQTLKIVDLRPFDAYEQAHLPGALHIDTALLGRAEAPVVGLLPNAQGAKALATALGLNKNDHIVAYDNGASTAAARLIWVLHAYGFENTSWLNGGFSAWTAASHTLSTEAYELEASHIELSFTPGNVLQVEEVEALLASSDLAVIDARSAGEFEGSDARSARGGHVPTANHCEWTTAFNEDGLLKSDDELHALFNNANASPEKNVVVYCQSHQRSSLTYLVLKHLGFDRVSAIDGAYSAWGNHATAPVSTGR